VALAEEPLIRVVAAEELAVFELFVLKHFVYL
jgi:hypothetical protein